MLETLPCILESPYVGDNYEGCIPNLYILLVTTQGYHMPVPRFCTCFYVSFPKLSPDLVFHMNPENFARTVGDMFLLMSLGTYLGVFQNLISSIVRGISPIRILSTRRRGWKLLFLVDLYHFLRKNCFSGSGIL